MRRRRGKARHAEPATPATETPSMEALGPSARVRGPDAAQAPHTSLLAQLPQPVLTTVLSYLPAAELCQVSSSSLALYHLSGSNSLWRHHLITDFTVTSTEANSKPQYPDSDARPPGHFKRMYAERLRKHMHDREVNVANKQRAYERRVRDYVRTCRRRHAVLHLFPESMLHRLMPDDFRALLVVVYSVLLLLVGFICFKLRSFVLRLVSGLAGMVVDGLCWWFPIAVRTAVALLPLVAILCSFEAAAVRQHVPFGWYNRPLAWVFGSAVVSVVSEVVVSVSVPARILLFLGRSLPVKYVAPFAALTFASISVVKLFRGGRVLPFAAAAATAAAVTAFYVYFQISVSTLLFHVAVWVARVFCVGGVGVTAFITVVNRFRHRDPALAWAGMTVAWGALEVLANWLSYPIWLFTLGDIYDGVILCLRFASSVIACVLYPFCLGLLSGWVLPLPWSHGIRRDRSFAGFLLVVVGIAFVVQAVLHSVVVKRGLHPEELWRYFDSPNPKQLGDPPLHDATGVIRPALSAADALLFRNSIGAFCANQA